MPSKKSDKRKWWKRLQNFAKTHISLTVIIAAAMMLELTTGIMYYTAQSIIERTVEMLMWREMNAVSLSIRNQLAKVEITLDNMSWVVTDDLEEPDSLYEVAYKLVMNNPAILGSSITCIPNLYPQKGYWFEPYAVRRDDGTIELMQLGSASHDYTKSDFYTQPIARGTGYWCEPYVDADGAQATVTSYGVPVRNKQGKTVAVVDADLSLDWLDGVMNEGKIYSLSQRFLMTGKYNILAGGDSVKCSSIIERSKVADSTEYFTMDDEKGRLKHVFLMDVGGKTDWKLICVLDDGEVFGRLRQVRWMLLLLVLAGFLLSGFIVWRTSRNLRRLRKVNEEKERISSELRVASKIQQSMLPPGYLKEEQVEIMGSLVPAREVGGDLFDYFIRDEKLFFCIGDVSGKGTPAAMLMASTRSLFRAFSSHNSDPARILQRVNVAACEGNDSNMFVTLFIGILDLPTGHLRYCNAGHDAPYVMAGGQYVLLAAEPHLPVGVLSDMRYEVQETWMQPDSSMFLYTDGLTEAMNGRHQQFGEQQVEAVLATCTGLLPKQLLVTVSKAVHQFVGDAEQSDDLTMLAIRYTPRKFEHVLTETLTLKNSVSEVARLSSFQKEVYEKMNLEKSLARQLRLAVEEAVVNVIEYAYPEDTDGSVEIRMLSDGQQLKVLIIDSGVPFDPTAMEKTDTTLAVEDRQIGGLGIHLVRELMDTINYERIGGQNILTLIKLINNKNTKGEIL